MMKCKQCQSLLESYFDRELDAVTAERVSAHVDKCRPCNQELKQLSAELETYQIYEHELDVPPNLWINVQQQIAPQRNSGRLLRFGSMPIALLKQPYLQFRLATSLVVVFFLLLGAFAGNRYLNRNKTVAEQMPTSQPRPPVANPPVSESGEARLSPMVTAQAENNSFAGRPKRATAQTPRSRLRAEENLTQVIHNAEKKYLSAIALIRRDAAQRSPRLDSETRVRLSGALADIDRTILRARNLVRQNPNDPVAVQYMLSAYENKVDVLREMGSY
jgi:hypothetical protein